MSKDLPELETGNGLGGEKMTEKQLKFSRWFISHQILLKKILIGMIAGVAGVFWIYALVGFVDWAFVTGPKERANLKTILQIKTHPEAMQSIKGEAISFGSARVFAGGLGKYDLFAQAANSNKRWWAEFEYRFVGEGYTGNWKKGFIIPEKKKYIADLGVERAYRPTNIRLQTQNLKYHRIDVHKIPNYTKWSGQRLNIAVSNKVFNPTAIQNKKKIASLKFKASNNTAYGYWSIGFYALLYRGEQLVAINYLRADKFKSGEERDLQIYFYEGLPTITKYEVVQEINIFDKSVYMEQ